MNAPNKKPAGAGSFWILVDFVMLTNSSHVSDTVLEGKACLVLVVGRYVNSPHILKSPKLMEVQFCGHALAIKHLSKRDFCLCLCAFV